MIVPVACAGSLRRCLIGSRGNLLDRKELGSRVQLRQIEANGTRPGGDLGVQLRGQSPRPRYWATLRSLYTSCVEIRTHVYIPVRLQPGQREQRHEGRNAAGGDTGCEPVGSLWLSSGLYQADMPHSRHAHIRINKLLNTLAPACHVSCCQSVSRSRCLPFSRSLHHNSRTIDLLYSHRVVTFCGIFCIFRDTTPI